MTKKYILPYLAEGYNYNEEITTLGSIGYKTNWKYFNGSTYRTPSNTFLPLILNDGTILLIGTTTKNHTNDDGSITKTLAGMTIHVDINGTSPPKYSGKRFILYDISFYTKYKNIFLSKIWFLQFYWECCTPIFI